MTDPLIEEFIRYVGAEKGLSLHTQEAYRRDLYQFLSLVRAEQAGWPPNLQAVEDFVKAQAQRGKKASSQVRSLVAIKVFLAYLYREKHIAQNLSTLVECPKVWQEVPTVLNSRELDGLLSAPDPRTDSGIRDRAILELLYGTGIRVSELCRLELYDVSDAAIRVLGKGSKERIVPVAKKALLAIDAYLNQVRSKFESEKNTKLFVSDRGTPLDRVFVWRQVKKYASQIGLEKKISPHTFRHTYASHLLDGGADLRIIQELLGHSQISSTDRYTHVSKAQLREVFRAFHPRYRDSCKDRHKLDNQPFGP